MLFRSRGIGKTEMEASKLVFEKTKERRGHPEEPPPTVSDGWGGIREAMVEVYGKVPEYKGVGRPPEKKRPQEGWQYLQIVKERTDTGASHRYTLEGGLRRKRRGTRTVGAADRLRRTHASDDAPHERTTHAKGVGLLEGASDAPCVSGLGRRCLQPNAPVENVARG